MSWGESGFNTKSYIRSLKKPNLEVNERQFSFAIKENFRLKHFLILCT